MTNRPIYRMEKRPEYVYVASSWRNPLQDKVCQVLANYNVPHYDFKNPEPNTGFSWDEVMPPFSKLDDNGNIDVQTYLKLLRHNRSIEGYESDYAAMQKADTVVLVLPCGKSAHLELGWAVGQGKNTAIILEEPCQPELMYKMVDFLAPTLYHLLDWMRL